MDGLVIYLCGGEGGREYMELATFWLVIYKFIEFDLDRFGLRGRSVESELRLRGIFSWERIWFPMEFGVQVVHLRGIQYRSNSL